MTDPDLRIWSLELTDPDAIRPPRRPAPEGFTVHRTEDPLQGRDLYRAIGGDFNWTDRLPWTDADWAAFAATAETWIARVGGEVAGYYELVVADGSCEIRSFGLLEHVRGTGLGGHLLVDALRRGLQRAPRVWLHTCTDDGPHALPNYRARGLVVFEERTSWPVPPPPGAATD